jgi:TnpA family transposase
MPASSRTARRCRRLTEACSAVLAFMHRHPIATTWGRSDLASSDMMSLEIPAPRQ